MSKCSNNKLIIKVPASSDFPVTVTLKPGQSACISMEDTHTPYPQKETMYYDPSLVHGLKERISRLEKDGKELAEAYKEALEKIKDLEDWERPL